MKTDEINHETIYEILTLFIRINKKFDQIENHAIDIGGGIKLYPSELHVIEAIGNNYANNVTKLSVRFGITKGAVSQVVNKLFEKDLVSKERNRDYGKEIILSLTEQGWTAFDIQNEFHKKMAHEFIKYLDTFTPGQIDSFLEIMSKIEDYVETFLRNDVP